MKTLILLSIIIGVTFVTKCRSSRDDNLQRSIDETLSLIDEGQSAINIGETDQVVLFFGNSKSGISTIVEILEGDSSQLRTDINELGNIYITDTRNWIGYSFQSHTAIPKFIQSSDNVFYYDLPGINDDNGEPKEFGQGFINIATSQFLHDVLSSSRSVKIVLVVDSSLVTPHDANNRLLEYFHNLKTLINNIAVYENSLCLIVNKVDTTITESDYKEKVMSYVNSIASSAQKSGLDRDEIQFITDLTKILNSKEDGQYSRVSLMNVPRKSAVPLDNDEQVERNKVLTRYMVDRLSFADKEYLKTGYPISDKTRTIMVDIIDYVRRNITEIISPLPRYVRQYYEQKIESITDIQEFIQATKSELHQFETLIKEVHQAQTIDDLVFTLKPYLSGLGITVPDHIFNDLSQASGIIKRIEVMSGYKAELLSNSWILTVDKMTEECYNVLTWYQFVMDLYDHLSDYSVQTQLQRFNVKNLGDWGKTDSEQGLVIDGENFNQFLETVVKYFDGLHSEYENVIDSDATDLKILELNTIIKRSLQSPIVVKKENGVTTITRDSITLSNASEYINSAGVFSVMALKSLIIDVDLNLTPNQNLALYSPKWISNGTRFINLPGADAKDYTSAAQPLHDGRPGLPGGNGGSFFGIGEFSKHLDLRIKSWGGKGGKGETGGIGSNGTDRSDKACVDSKCKFNTESGTNYLGFHSGAVYFDENACGGSGMNGGVGGFGGNPGYLSMNWLFPNKDVVEFERTPGANGLDGEGGVGGKGGATDHFIVENCRAENKCISYDYNLQLTDLFPPGPKGEKGKNNVGLLSASPVATGHLFSESLNQYKAHISQNLHDKFVQNDMAELYEFVNIDPPIDDIYQINDYFADFRLTNNASQTDIFYYYKVLALRIIQNTNHIVQNNPENKKALAQLMASIFGRINRIRMQNGNYITSDISAYFDSIYLRLKNLQGYIQGHSKYEIGLLQADINDDFKATIVKRIDEIERFVEYQKPEFEGVIQYSYEDVEVSLKYIGQLEAEGEMMEEKADMEKEEIKELLLRDTIGDVVFFGLETVADILQAGKSALEVVTHGASIPENLELGFHDDNIILPDSLLKLQVNLIEKIQKRRNLTADFLKIVHEELSTELHSDDDILKQINNTINILTHGTTHTVQELLRPIIRDMKYKIIKSKKEYLEKHLANVIISGLPNVVEHINQNQENLNVINTAIKQDGRILTLNYYSNKIEHQILAMAFGLSKNIKDVQLNAKNGVVLDIEDWFVQASLQNLLTEINKLLNTFDIKIFPLENINYIITTVTDVYDRVQKWQKMDKFKDYLQNIYSPDADGIVITNEQVISDMAEADLDLEKSTVLSLYNMAVQAFEQWVFPFADTYTWDIDEDQDVGELSNQAVQSVLRMRSEVLHYYARTDEYKPYVTESDFTSEGRTTKSFAVWDNENYNEKIRNLLSGKEVILSSSVFDRDALKSTNKLKLNLKLKKGYENLQTELDDIFVYYDVKIIQLGVHYYTYNGSTYLINGFDFPFSYSNDVNSNGNPIRYDEGYSQILNGKFMLSPFSTWSFQIHMGFFKAGRNSFEDLTRFKDIVDLELIGHGIYLRHINGNVPNLNLDEHYLKL